MKALIRVGLDSPAGCFLGTSSWLKANVLKRLGNEDFAPARHHLNLVVVHQVGQDKSFGDPFQIGFIDRIASSGSAVSQITKKTNMVRDLFPVLIIHARSLGKATRLDLWAANRALSIGKNPYLSGPPNAVTWDGRTTDRA